MEHLVDVAFILLALHLACTRSNGEIWLLDQTLLTPKYETPLQGSKSKIEKLYFSQDCKCMAYYVSKTAGDPKRFPAILHLGNEALLCIQLGCGKNGGPLQIFVRSEKLDLLRKSAGSLHVDLGNAVLVLLALETFHHRAG